MQFINNWIYQLTADWSATATDLPVPGDAKGRLGDGAYLLTLVNSADATEQTTWEIVGVLVEGGVVTVTRAQEGTAAQAWPVGTIIYSGLTAGTMSDLSTRVGALENHGGGGATIGRIVQEPILGVSLDYLSTFWVMDLSQTMIIKFPEGIVGSTVQLQLQLFNPSSNVISAVVDEAGLPLWGGPIEVQPLNIATYELLSTGGAWMILSQQTMAIPEESIGEPPTDNPGGGEEPPA